MWKSAARLPGSSVSSSRFASHPPPRVQIPAQVDPRVTPFKLQRSGVIAVIVLVIALSMAGCASFEPLPAHTLRHRPSPVVQDPRGFALLSSLGVVPRLRVTHVDELALASGRLTGPVQVGGVTSPAAGSTELGVWLTPGFHVIRVEFIRNIEAGISFTRAELPIQVFAGHTYIVQPQVTTDYGRVSFSLADQGRAFPLHCLPGSVLSATRPGPDGIRSPYTDSDLQTCRTLAHR